MYQDERPVLNRVPAPAGLIFPEDMLLSGNRMATAAQAAAPSITNPRSPTMGRILSTLTRTRRAGAPGRIRSAHFQSGVMS